MNRNCLKIVYGESVLIFFVKIKITGSILGPAGKEKKKKKKLPARLLVRPWPDQPDRLLRPCDRIGAFVTNFLTSSNARCCTAAQFHGTSFLMSCRMGSIVSVCCFWADFPEAELQATNRVHRLRIVECPPVTGVTTI